MTLGLLELKLTFDATIYYFNEYYLNHIENFLVICGDWTRYNPDVNITYLHQFDNKIRSNTFLRLIDDGFAAYLLL